MINKVRILVQGQELKWRYNPPLIIDDSLRQVLFKFTIPNLVDGAILTAQFTQGINTYSILINSNKETIIPPEGTLNEWIEVDTLIIPQLTEEELKQQRILELEKELKLLKNS